jgi:hypothetical protein
MLISYSQKFIFLHNYKVAGSSVKRALAPYSVQNPSAWHNLNSFFGERSVPLARILNSLNGSLNIASRLDHHSNAKDSEGFLPDDVWGNYYKFGFVRNPWDWQVSMYHFMRTKKDHFQHKLVSRFKNFEEYLEWRVSSDINLQVDFFKDSSGTVSMDYIGKLENINEDFSVICEAVGISCVIPFVNKTNHQHYKRHYNERTRKLIADHFIEDIETFKYCF